ncbi:MAG: hypothetical protein UGF45_09885 [Massilioclostridium sp.]|nr:hypothetical protein [Massilioclostridium sp.]MEE1492297.1 hypothetical protein [Massilioclostridium sp.]
MIKPSTHKVTNYINDNLYHTIKEIQRISRKRSLTTTMRMLLWMGVNQYKAQATQRRAQQIDDIANGRNDDAIHISSL